jgi:hypothetical protein
MHYVSSLACEWFGQLMLRCILCVRWQRRGLFNTCLDTFWVLVGNFVGMHFVSLMAWNRFGGHAFHVFAGMVLVFVNISRDMFGILACVGGVWSTNVEIHFVSTLPWEQGQYHFVSLQSWN